MNLRGIRRSGPRWARRAWAAVRLLRPLNVAMILVGVALGGVLSGGVGAVQGVAAARLLRAALSAAMIGAAANALNDVFDLEIDRVNRPERPLPSGLVSVGAARGLAGVGTAGGLVLAATLSTTHLTLALGVVGMLLVYNAALKRVALAGNAVVALVIGTALLYGGWAVGPPGPALIGAAFAFLTTLAREIVKDIEDVAGDAAAGARTLPLVLGVGASTRAVLGLLVVTLLLTPLPFLVLDYTGLFLVLMLAADGLLLRALWLLLDPQPEQQARQASQVMKAVMAAGMAALALGAIVQVGG